MKKLLSILLILAMISSLGVTAFAEDRREITSAEFPFYLMGDDSGEKVTLYFLDGVNDLPYVELNDWMDLLNMIIGDEDDENDPSNITDANVTGFTFVNTYTQADEEKPTGNGDYGAFYAQKNTSGTYGDKTQAFPITITVTFDDYNGDKALDLKNADGETIAELEEVSTNVWAQTVNLKDGEIAYFENLPDGASVSVVEDLTTDPGSAITNAAFYQQTSASVTAGGTAASGTVVDKDGNTYTATKSKDVFALTKITAAAVVYNDANADKANNVNINNESKYDPGATGILLSNLPYIVLALVAIGGMVAYVVIRRRQSDEA